MGISAARFVALRESTPGDYTPVLSVSGGRRTDDATMEQIADEAIDRLREETGDARLVSRRPAGGPRTPSYSQVVATSVAIDGTVHALTRLPAILGLVDAPRDDQRAVLIVSCTSLTEQVAVVGPEFRRLVEGLRVDADQASDRQ